MDSIEGSKDINAKIVDVTYTGGRDGYPDHIRQQAIQYYLEEWV